MKGYGDLIGTLPGHAECVVGLGFSPDGKWLASCSTDGTVAISRDGRLLGSGGPGHVNLWELPSGRLRRRIKTGEKEGMLGLDLSPDGRWLATDGLSASRVRTTDSGAVVGELRGHEDGTYQVHFSPDGGEIATASADASFRLWKVRDGSLKRIFSRRPLNAPVSSLAFSPDGSAEALGSANGRVHVWNVRDGSFKSVFHQHGGPVLALAFSVDGAWLFSGSADRTMRLWDMSLGTIAGTLPLFDRVDAIGTLAVGGTQNLIASASGPLASTSLDHSIKLWPTHGDRPSLVLDGHAGNVVSVAFAEGADLLASASTDRTVKLWDSRSGKCLLTLPLDVPAEVVAFPPDARWLAAGLADGRVRVLDPKTLATLREWRAHPRPVQSLAVSRDGRWIATASGDGNAVVWDSATGGEVRRFTHITSQYLPLAFHPQQPVERRRRAQEAFTRRLLQSVEEERQRIAGELHDSLGQNLQIIKNRAVMGLQQGGVPSGLAEQLREISGGAARAIAEVRAITRALRPAELDRGGLTQAIGWLGEAVAESSGLSIEPDLEKVDGWLSPEDEVNLYRIVQEALNNAVKHAAATRLTLELKRTGAALHLSVFDNGKGFDPAARAAAPSHGGGGHGLTGMEERARLMGGRAEIQSAPGKGTRLTVTIKTGKPFAPATAAKSNP